MTPLFKKLNFKNHPEILIINAPDSFSHEMESMMRFSRINTDPGQAEKVAFILAFTTKQSEVDSLSPVLATKFTENGVLWFAYPKQTSKKYKCDFNRDNGWRVLKTLGFEGVRMVAIDEDWSALRFRPTAPVKINK